MASDIWEVTDEIIILDFSHAAISIKLSNLLICLSCLLLEKYNFYEKCVYCIDLLNNFFFKSCLF